MGMEYRVSKNLNDTPYTPVRQTEWINIMYIIIPVRLSLGLGVVKDKLRTSTSSWSWSEDFDV